MEPSLTSAIQTERLVLRPLRQDDLHSLHAVFNDPQVAKHLSGLRTLSQTQAFLDWTLKSYAWYGVGFLAVELKSDGSYIGEVGLNAMDTMERMALFAESPLSPAEYDVSIDWHLHSKYWHHGYATEAALACRDYGFSALNRERLVSFIVPENDASIRVARRLGMAYEKSIVRWEKTVAVYSVTSNRALERGNGAAP